MSKLNMNPDFEEDEKGGGGSAAQVEGNQRKVDVDEELLENQEGDEEEKKPEGEEPKGEEEVQAEPSTVEKPGTESSDGDDEDADADAGKERELAGLTKEESKIEEDIRTTKERIVEKRTARREAREDLKDAKPDKGSEEKIDLSDIPEEEQNNIEKVIRAKGYVPKAEIQAENFKMTQKDLENTFFDKNPQYKPENDKDDVLYEALQSEIGMFAKPSSPSKVTAILQRAHDRVKVKYPSRFPKSKPTDADGDAAARAKMNLAGTGSRGSGPSGSKKADVYGPNLSKKGDGKLTEAQKEHYRTSGWSEEDIIDMDKG